MEEQASASWSQSEYSEDMTSFDDQSSGSSRPTIASAPAPAPLPAEQPPLQQPEQVPWPAPQPEAPPGGIASYENVRAGEVEGLLKVSDEGLQFTPYMAPTTLPWYSDISWKDVTCKEFFTEQVKAGYKSYSTMLTKYNLKMGVFPSKEVTFCIMDREEYDRLQCDFDVRGQGSTPPEPNGLSVDPGFHLDDYDHAEAVYNEMEDEIENVHWQNQEDVEHDTNAMEEEVHWTEEDDEDDFSRNQGWSTQDTTAPPTTQSSCYPVYCRNQVGSLVLTPNQLQFVPDQHAVKVKSIPYAAFAGQPFFSPFNYPRAQMGLQYYTTVGQNKRVGFDLANHSELARLQDDIRARMRPFQNAPRVRVFVPPPKDDSSVNSTVSQPQGGGGVKKGHMKAAPPPIDPSFTEDTTTSYYGGNTVAADAVPLVARRVPFHKEESSRRLTLLFISYCCIVTLTGLTLSILFGYFFGPRRPREQYIRTQAPYEIGDNYLGNNSPTLPPTSAPREEWNSSAVTMTRGEPGVVENQGTVEQLNPVEGMRGDLRPGTAIGISNGGPVRGSENFGVVTMAPTTQPPIGTVVETSVTTAPPTFPPTTAAAETSAPTSEAPATDAPTALEPTTDAPTTAEPTSATTAELTVVTPSPTTVEPTPAPTFPPTTAAPTTLATRSSKSIPQLLMESSFDNGLAIRTSGTPQQAAYLLIKVSGLLDEAPSDDVILQKFAISSLYYAAGGQDWNDGSNDWKDLVASDCNKDHIICDDTTQAPVGIDMPSNNMKGFIPPEIGSLDKLTSISFKDNDLQGTIPPELSNLTNLQTLDLTGNPGLEGPVPESVRGLPRLTDIKVDLP